jgi:hypothetical protein
MQFCILVKAVNIYFTSHNLPYNNARFDTVISDIVADTNQIVTSKI